MARAWSQKQAPGSLFFGSLQDFLKIIYGGITPLILGQRCFLAGVFTHLEEDDTVVFYF